MQTLFPWLLLLFRLGLGALFIWSGIAKYQHFDAFLSAVYDYELIPVWMVTFFGYMLPGVEILCGAYLALGLFTRWAASTTGFLLLLFIVALFLVLMRGEPIDCGCFMGGNNDPVTWKKWWEDVAMLLACTALVRWPNTPLSLDQLLNKLPSPTDTN